MSVRLSVLAGLSLLLAGFATAATSSANMNVKLQINAECLISAVPDLDFGASGVLAANLDATSTITVQCTSGTPYTVSLSAGNGAGATVSARLLTGPSLQTVTYSVYRDASRTQVWGTTIGTNTVAGTGSGATQTLTAYGRIAAQTTPGTGAYSDIVTATVTY
jgi:spore coat protein U-like protein